MLSLMLLPRLTTRVALFLALACVLAAQPLRAQSAADSGWFEANPSAAAAAPADTGSAAEPERESLPPSPLLRDNQSGSASAPAEIDPEDADPRALQDFRPRLDPYGSWVQHPTYGTVWVPSPSHVGSNFAPYVSSGHWSLTEDGEWIWVSDYPFGSVVFHYGRWVWISGAGWAWIPGYRYAPAWVSWRVPTGSHAYVGWAPLGPDYVWYNGAAVSIWWGVSTPWVFVPSAYVFYPRVHYYVVRDRAFLPRLAASTRRYVPATPRATLRSGARSYTSAAPRSAPFQGRARGPSLAAARVPAQAVPRERVRAVPPIAASPRSATPMRNAAAPGSAVPLRSAAAPRRAAPMRSAPSRFDSRPAPGARRPVESLPQRHVAPAPDRAAPVRSRPAPQSSSPASAAPQRTERFRPAREAPMRSLPAPRAPRSSPGVAPRSPRGRH